MSASNPVPVTIPGVVQFWPQQSPIDLGPSITADFPRKYFKVHYPSKVLGTFKKDPPPDDHGFNVVLKGDQKAYAVFHEQKCWLRKIHFHSRSEHRHNGADFPLEIHLVHEIEEPLFGATHLVLGVFVSDMTKKTTPSSFRNITRFLQQPVLRAQVANSALRVGDTENLNEPPSGDIQFNPQHFLPKSENFYRYEGSLTTPPYSEAISWLVFQQPVEVADDIEEIKKYANHDARQPQPLCRRIVLKNF